MTEKELTIRYRAYKSADELPQADAELVRKAIDARSGSYSPYSHFQVGAALRLADGSIVTGANQENAAYPSGLCAERTAMFAAGATRPGVAFDALAIAASDHGVLCENPATPCGACRQVMAEYQSLYGRPLRVFLVGAGSILAFDKVDDILPFIFDSLKV